jgi:alpha-mannosidase
MPDFTPYITKDLERTLVAIEKRIYRTVGDLEITAWRTPEPEPFDRRCSGQELRLCVGDKWGDLFDCAWFCFRGRVPDEAAGQPVVLLLDVNGEMCVVDAAGVPVRGLTSGSPVFELAMGQPGKRVLPLSPAAEGGEPIEVWADAGCNDLFGNLIGNGTVKEASVAICHEETRGLYYDFEVLLDSVTVLAPQSARHQQILVALNDAAHLLRGEFSPETVRAARALLAPALAKRGGDPSLRISALGHAHMDLGWLWPIRETKRKGARTFATVLRNMARYGDYVFSASQAQLFHWMKESYPALYAGIRQRVLEGRIEPQGALWVECDTNLTSGESLVRQLLHGHRFFRDEFSADVRYVWLPDTFGYSAALPQILRRAGMRYFSTQKLSWSLINTFPHHSFRWQGIDGSQVLVHMLPEETYNSSAAPRAVGKIEANYRDKGVSDRALLVFGIGDGGGGPGEEHLERLARLGDFAGLSPVKQETTAAFFEQWSKDASRFATWAGELYLERHEGTLTTHGRNKRYNRRMEQALRELEWLAAWAELACGFPYPTSRLDAIWKEVLLYQFHDILPGSSIKRVYDETTPRYEALLAEVAALIAERQRALADCIETAGMEKPVVVFNSLSWERCEWFRLTAGWRRVAVPALGYTVMDAAGAGETIPDVYAAADRLENDRLRVRFDQEGAIVSIYDKLAEREAVAAGESANRLAVYRDPGDPWDFPMDYAESAPRYMELVASEAHLDGPRAVLTQTYRLGHSVVVQEISLTAGSSLLVFATRANWRERGTMLRVAFPVAVQADEATYEIQFGHVRRPTHRNTTWDLARDEVAGHKWVDLSQRDYGIALLNDCKYGHKIKGHVIDLDLIRSVPYPGPQLVRDEDVPIGEPHHGYTDQEDHEFRYALYPHAGGPVTSGVIRAAYEFNIPLHAITTQTHAGNRPAADSFLHITAENVIVEAVKRAEDGSGVIVRLYEAAQAGTRTTVDFHFPVQTVAETNLLEEDGRPLALQDGAVVLELRPFEIKTLAATPVT